MNLTPLQSSPIQAGSSSLNFLNLNASYVNQTESESPMSD